MGLRKDLQFAIKKKKISVAKLARLADIHHDTIYKFLSGETEMTAANLDKLFEVLRKSTAILNVKNEVNPDNQ